MPHMGTFSSSTGGASRVRLVRKKAHCAAQSSLTEVIVAVAILTIVVWGMVGFLMNGRILVERTGQGVIAAQIAAAAVGQYARHGVRLGRHHERNTDGQRPHVHVGC